MKYWKKISHTEQAERIDAALEINIDYKNKITLGIPASSLDPHVFYDRASFLKDAPLLRTYIQNPNHIGCHTLGESEMFFKGTQDIEREVIELLSVDVLKAAPESCDGYVASGGTEANIQAAWIYRNYFAREYNARYDEIALLGSADTHYSIAKAANLLHLTWYSVPVYDDTRMIVQEALDATLARAKADGVKYFIVIANMATTMFGSVDDPSVYVHALKQHGLHYKLHLDGAFGGFIFPISHPDSHINFADEHVSSITLDAHKMLQAPYGTGIFIARKGLMEYAYTKEAQYVHGMDITLSGSRSGTNAVAIWMILMTYGPHGWFEKINKLLYRTDWLCNQLDKMQIAYYRYPKMNIVTIRAKHVPADIAERYGLVPDTHDGKTLWYKIVIMDHVEVEHLEEFLENLPAIND